MLAYYLVSIVAILVGPILAVQAQKYIELRREARSRKLHIFRTLMATRATTLAPLHVEALNLIDIEFDAKKKRDKRVVDAWKVYLDHLGDKRDNNDQVAVRAWFEKNSDLLTRLLYEMATCLGFEFDEVHIRRGGYIPVGLYNIEEEQHLIRREIAKILKGESSFPMRVTDFPLIVDDATTAAQVRQILPEILQRLGIESKITGLPEVNPAPNVTDIRRENQIDLVPRKSETAKG